MVERIGSRNEVLEFSEQIFQSKQCPNTFVEWEFVLKQIDCARRPAKIQRAFMIALKATVRCSESDNKCGLDQNQLRN
jgi:hypothetical protein